MSSPYIQYQELGSSPAQSTPQLQEREQTLWKFLARVSSSLSLVGFLVIPLAFGDEEDTPHVNRVATIVASGILIGFAYILSFILVLFQSHERLFLIHSLFLPCLTSNLLGLFNVVLNVLCRNLVPVRRVETLSMSISAAFAFLYALGALWVYARDVNKGIRGESNRLLTDEEMQRQQLSRLLEPNSPRRMLSPKAMQKTFRVNVPGRISTFMPPPHEDGYYS